MVSIYFDKLFIGLIRVYVRDCRSFDDVEVGEVALKVTFVNIVMSFVGSSCCCSEERDLSSSHCRKISIEAFP